ncbi:hypothetical protein CROQUDRAFT_99176 [Cronartium quercuum f. sp. fusiforme G11]|uniref:Uncharacterized protein n=1 Tax=Cronartium quercuum f. sp. fusiforme G11 TaxID=708437 RepID=A0A9P6T718_9BASI|nr:hypothetical protein CROQUDRAFT_99176 [Cronartium quercuum f. sp. fusiforme G11]
MARKNGNDAFARARAQHGRSQCASIQYTLSQAYGSSKRISNNEMEVMGLAIAMVKIRTMLKDVKTSHSSLAIFSDSKTALDLLAKPLQPKSLQYLAKLNEKAVEEAREAANAAENQLILPIRNALTFSTIYRRNGVISPSPDVALEGQRFAKHVKVVEMPCDDSLASSLPILRLYHRFRLNKLKDLIWHW